MTAPEDRAALAARMAIRYAEALGAAGVTKAAGGLPVADVVRPVFEFMLERDAEIAAGLAALREKADYNDKLLRRNARALKAIADSEPVPAVPPVIAPFRPDQWQTALVPVFPPKPANGHSMPLPGIGEP